MTVRAGAWGLIAGAEGRAGSEEVAGAGWRGRRLG